MFKRFSFSFFSFCLVTVLSMSSVFASNDNQYIDAKGNYYNPITKESFTWKNDSISLDSAWTAKSFTFTIRNSLTSSYFRLSRSNAKIIMTTAYFCNYQGDIRSGNSGHRYTINLQRKATLFSGNPAQFTCPTTNVTKNLGSGFSKTSQYSIYITNNDSLSPGLYIHGEGKVVAW